MVTPPTRENVSLETMPGQPDCYYDQICALSQQTINDNFETLFKQRSADPDTDLTIISWAGEESHYGVLQATLLPLRIVIEPYPKEDGSPEIYYSLR